MSRKATKPAATPPKPAFEEPKTPPATPADPTLDPTKPADEQSKASLEAPSSESSTPDAAATVAGKIQPRTLAFGEMLKAGDIADPVAYADALRDGRVREINRPPLEPGEPVYEVEDDFKDAQAEDEKRRIRVTMVRRDGNIAVVKAVPDEALLPTAIILAKDELLALHIHAIASHSEQPSDTPSVDTVPKPPAGDEPDAQPQPPVPVTIGDVFGDLANFDETDGALVVRPELRISPGQARTQFRLYTVLTRRGVTLRRQQDVYGWLLDQVAASVQDGE